MTDSEHGCIIEWLQVSVWHCTWPVVIRACMATVNRAESQVVCKYPGKGHHIRGLGETAISAALTDLPAGDG